MSLRSLVSGNDAARRAPSRHLPPNTHKLKANLLRFRVTEFLSPRRMPTLFALIILASAIIGHCEWWAVVLNRLHALPMKQGRLPWMRLLHHLVVPAVPCLLTWKWFSASGPLGGGDWSTLGTVWQVFVVLCCLGCVSFVVSVVRWRMQLAAGIHSTDRIASVNEYIVDNDAGELSEKHRREVRGNPRKRRFVPANELWMYEINRRDVVIGAASRNGRPRGATEGTLSGDRAPEAAPTAKLRIAHLSDFHFIGTPGVGYFEDVCQAVIQQEPDLVVFSGDLIDDPACLPWIHRTLRPLADIAPCFYVLGNHDWHREPEVIRRHLDAAGWQDISGRVRSAVANGVAVSLAGSELPWMGSHPPPFDDDTADLRILVSHSPDEWPIAAERNCELMLAGHNHGGQIVLPLIGPVYSPSRSGVRFSGGLYRLGNLQLHVSRGLGSKDPVRWNCKPEVTLLDISFGDAPTR